MSSELFHIQLVEKYFIRIPTFFIPFVQTFIGNKRTNHFSSLTLSELLSLKNEFVQQFELSAEYLITEIKKIDKAHLSSDVIPTLIQNSLASETISGSKSSNMGTTIMGNKLQVNDVKHLQDICDRAVILFGNIIEINRQIQKYHNPPRIFKKAPYGQYKTDSDLISKLFWKNMNEQSARASKTELCRLTAQEYTKKTGYQISDKTVYRIVFG